MLGSNFASHSQGLRLVTAVTLFAQLRMLLFRLGLTPNSNVWVGAWWIGFLLAALMCTILAVPLLAFPPALPGKLTRIKFTHILRGAL